MSRVQVSAEEIQGHKPYEIAAKLKITERKVMNAFGDHF